MKCRLVNQDCFVEVQIPEVKTLISLSYCRLSNIQSVIIILAYFT
jgi:hypothetical protein